MNKFYRIFRQGLLAVLSTASILMSGPNAECQQDSSVWMLPSGPIHPGNYYGATVANGMIGIVSSPEPFQVKDMVLNGAYDTYGRGRVSNILKTFNFLDLYLDVNGQRVGTEGIRNFRQILDMRRAEFTTTFDYRDLVRVRYSYLALRQLPQSALLDITITALRKVSISPASVIEAPDILRNVQNYFEDINSPKGRLALMTSFAQSPTGRLEIAASDCFLFPEGPTDQPRVTHEMQDQNLQLMRFSRNLEPGQSYTFSVVGSTMTNSGGRDALNEAERLTIFAALQGRSNLIKAHRQAWRTLWKSDIIIHGDDSTQRDIHSMLYHLYSFVRAGTALSLSPMGLSGLGYNGHIFWDADLWMFPALLILHPRMARSMIDYRFRRLQAARRNAFEHGYRGAMYPWESAGSGNEETPVWALSGPFEHHITACVALAAWNYFCVTQDTAWLRSEGWPILKATADFWASRVQRNGPGRFDIDNVVAADEWAENVDNDAFTNAAAKANLRDAGKAARILGFPSDTDWEFVAGNIPILRFPDGVTREHASYHGEPIKQADVNLLAYPLTEIRDPARILKDLAYYEPRIGNGPAMSYAVLSILYSRLGEPQKAYELFIRGYTPNEVPPFGILAETAGGTNPYFATGAGGILQAMLSGFGGLEITDTGIVQLKTRLPRQWKSLEMTGVGARKLTFEVH